MPNRTVALLLLGLALAACGSDDEPEAPRVPAEGDAVLFQQILDGTLSPEEGFRRIAHSGGFPIATSAGFLFALREDAGLAPYVVEPVGAGAFLSRTLTSWAGISFAIVPIAAPEGAAYRFVTRFGDATTDPWARRVDYAGGHERTLVRASGPHLERWPEVEDPAAGVAARTVRVWVPAEAPTHFLYAHDGQNLFRSGVSWHLQDGAGPRTLLVGIDNTPDRFDEYTHVADDLGSGPVGGNAAAYADYVEHVVRPFVESRYGTPVRVGVIGSSLGGLVSYVQALRFPRTYDLVASLSGTMGWGSLGASSHERTIIEAYAALATCPEARFYLDSGGEGAACADLDGDGLEDDVDGGDNYCENVQLRDVLAGLGCSDVHYVWAPRAQHSEAAWWGRAPAILDLFEAL